MMMPELKRLARLGIEAEIAKWQQRLKDLDAEPEPRFKAHSVHWTQTPEGKRKMARIQKLRWAKNKKAPATTK